MAGSGGAVGSLGFQVGRVRVTNVPSPSEARYIRSIRDQMKTIRNNLLRTIDRIEGVTPAAIRFGLQPIFDESQELVPVDTGRLKRSGFIETRTQASGRISAEIGYGRFGIPHYAAFVHERTDIPHAGKTQAKFLEAAVNKHIGSFARRVQLHIKRESGVST